MTVLRSPLRPVLRSPLYSPLVGKWGGAFSPSALFQTGDILLWYDPSDLSTMFKDTVGTQPVTADGDSVALMLDKGQWGGKTLEQVLAAQTELLVNGGFGADASWTKGTGWTISGGVASFNNASGAALTQARATTAGKTYEISFDLVGTGAVVVQLSSPGSTPSGSLTGAGRKTVRLTAGGNYANFAFSAIAGSNLSVDNVTMKEIPGYHRVQATGTSMPKWKTAAGLSRFLYDGSDDSNQTSAINWGTDKATIIAGVTKSTDTAYQVLTEFSASVSTNNGSFSVLTTSGQGVALPNAFSFGLRGSALAGYDATVYAAGNKYVVAVRLDIAGATVADEVKPQINGAVPGTLTSTAGANAGTGNFGNYVLNFGRRNNASLPLNGSEHQFIAINRLLSDAELLRGVGFVAEKTGVTL